MFVCGATYGTTFFDAHRDSGKRFVVRADEMLTAFLELQAAINRQFDAQLESYA
jgi:hypothetical protein